MTRFPAAVLVMLALGFSIAAQRATPPTSPDVLLKATATRELIDGDVEAAIRTYDQIARDYKESRPDVAAEAMLRRARSYDRLRRPDAAAAYAEIVRAYPAAREAVEARARLATLSASARQMAGASWQDVSSGAASTQDISPDGRLALAMVADGTIVDIVLQDLASKVTTTLVEGSETTMPVSPRFSPDSQRVAYAVGAVQPPGLAPAGFAIHVIASAPGSKPQVVVPMQMGVQLTPVAWSADGRSVLVWSGSAGPKASGPPSLTWVSLADGSRKTVVDFPAWRQITPFNGLALSPDGSSIALSAVAREGAAERHIYVMNSDGTNEIDLVRMAGRNENPVWTADGRHVLFIGDRSGSRALWAAEVSRAASNDPVRVRPDAAGRLIRVTAAGDLYREDSEGGGQRVFIAEQDTIGWRIVQVLIGEGVGWSPDGKSIAFLRQREGAMDVIFRSVDTGEERTSSRPRLSLAQVRWAPDSSGVLVGVPREDASEPAMYFVSAATGAFTRLLPRDTPDHFRGMVTEFSRDGRTLFMHTRKAAGGRIAGIVGVDLASGQERSVATFAGDGLSGAGAPGLAVSPDGATLVAQVFADQSGQVGRLLALRTDGSGYQDLISQFPVTTTPSLARWTPDGLGVLFFEGRPGNWRLMRVTSNGGAPQAAGLDSATLRTAMPVPTLVMPLSLDVSPDGNRIAFGAGTRARFDLSKLEGIASLIGAPR